MNAALTRRAETNFVYPQLLRQLSVLCYPACNFMLVNKKRKERKRDLLDGVQDLHSCKKLDNVHVSCMQGSE